MPKKLKIVFWGKGDRALGCLNALLTSKHKISLIVAHPSSEGAAARCISQRAEELNIECTEPEDPNSADFVEVLKKQNADLFVLGGYGKIIKQNVINLPKIMAINLHGGKLPEYRGSSPINWSLINNEKQFGISIIKVDSGVDTGDIIGEMLFPISEHDTVKDLHLKANQEFPKLLLNVVDQISNANFKLIKQDNSKARYFPLRFPQDGLILWDTLSALQAYNKIRALTTPSPCAFTYFGKREVKIIQAKLSNQEYFGEAGRIYKKTKSGILVCANDKCLWITQAVFTDNNQSIFESIKRYDCLATVREAALAYYRE